MTSSPDATRPQADGASAQDARLRQAGRGLLLELYAALRSLKLYPLENATVQKALYDLESSAETLLQAEGDIEVRLAGDFIFVNSTRLRLELDNYASFSHILTMFRTFEIGTLRVLPGANRREWQIFLSLLLSLSSRSVNEDLLTELQRRMADGEVRHLDLERSQPQQEGLRESEEAREVAKRTYSQGVAVTRDVITGIRLGRATSVKRVKRAVQMIVDQVLNNETSLMGLTTIRDYDEYTFTHSVNVCIFAVALGKKLGFSKLQLYDLGMTALLHDVGKARVPLDILNKTTGLDEPEWKVMQAHPWLGALTLFGLRGYDEIPYRSILVAYEHHMKQDLTGYPRCVRPRSLGMFSRIVSVADGFDAATTRRSYQTVPIEPDQVLREMWENPKRGYDTVLVKALINLIGVYPVGTCVILDTFEVAIVAAPNPEATQLNRPLVRLVIGSEGGAIPPPGTPVNLAERDSSGAYLRSIVKVTNPSRYGLTVGDYLSESRLDITWAQLRADGRNALIPYLTAGYPTVATSLAALRAAADVADIIEVGVPFSDPLADGPTIQRSTFEALRQGMTLRGTLDLIRDAALSRPVVVFSYLNPVLSYGIDRFLRDAGALGVAGLLLTDLPAGTDPAIERAVAASRLDLIRLVAPTTRPERLAHAVLGAAGFIYLVARLGVTGASTALAADLPGTVAAVRAATSLPIAVGFGISTPMQAATVAKLADGVVVGSALVDILGTRGVDAATDFLRGLREAMDGVEARR